MKVFSLILTIGVTGFIAVATGCNDGAYSPHESDCNQFYQCVHGRNQAQRCGSGLHWNRKANNCDWPANAGCTTDGSSTTSGSTSSSSTTSEPGPSPNNEITKREFMDAVTRNNYERPTEEQYRYFVNGLSKGGISRKMEAAMALAQFMHESGGLLKKREDGCSGSNGCPGKYPDWNNDCERPGQSYYGRGYIQLSYCSNYRAASRYLGLGDQLAEDPDRVAQSEELSWGVSFYFWKNEVQRVVGTNNEAFGRTTKAINGQSEECNGRNRDKSESRFRIYKNVFKAFGILGQPNESGCYN